MEFSYDLHLIVRARENKLINNLKQNVMKTLFKNKIWKSIFLMLFAGMNIMCGQKHQTTTNNPVQTEDGDKTGSPYFVIVGNTNENQEGLPLESTKADVTISGVIADISITQVYRNRGKSPIEAIYVFPASTRAAVYAMKMSIGERTIIAKIEEKNKARQDYETAKQNGQSASLLEQERPNVFTMNVANIMPADLINVTLRYTELLIPDEGIYEFVYPTVVGPRYTNGKETPNGTEPWVGNPYTKEGVAPAYEFGINVNINAGMPLSDVRCKTHKTNISYKSASEAVIALDPSESTGGNRDYILQYRLQGNAIQSGLLLFKGEGEGENFFLAMIQPPKNVTIQNIPPREYIFIVDVSGSMYGFPLDISKKLMKDLFKNLRTVDRFNVILFAGGSEVMAPQSLSATEENITKASNWIDKQQGGGGTELLPALAQALSMAIPEGYSHSFIIATDGYVTVEQAAFDLIRKNLNHANFFPFGIGSSVNRHLIEGMAHVGMGLPFVIEKPELATFTAEKFRKYIEQPVLTGISVSYNGFETYDVEPLTVPDVLSERPVIIYGKWKGNAAGTITLKGKSGDGVYTQTIKVSDYKASSQNVALKYLWARERIKILDDYSITGENEERVKIVTNLGLKYNLLTNYTSFIAIDSEVRNKGGNQTTVKQPLPLPDGVSNYAVGSSRSTSGAGGYSGGSLKRCDKSKSVNAPVAYQAISVDELEDNKDDGTLAYAEVSPEFKTGKKALDDFIKKNLTYPQDAAKISLEGKVMIQFIVDEKGNISDVQVIQGLITSMDNEAIRVVKLTNGMWKPGTQNGKAVKTYYTMEVKFELK
jgi:Ca-activated chloride channel homolog